MKRTVQNLASLFTNKKTYCYIFLFVYFGLTTIPEWFHPFSLIFVIWLLFFPVVALTLVVIGIWGVFVICVSVINKGRPASKYIFFAQISCISLLVFAVSILIASQTQFIYNHQKFDSEIWRASNFAYSGYDALTPRQRMFDNLVENVLPGKSKYEIEALLGESLHPYEKGTLLYILGPERNLISIDPEYIVIWFDDAGNFERYEIAIG